MTAQLRRIKVELRNINNLMRNLEDKVWIIEANEIADPNISIKLIKDSMLQLITAADESVKTLKQLSDRL